MQVYFEKDWDVNESQWGGFIISVTVVVDPEGNYIPFRWLSQREGLRFEKIYIGQQATVFCLNAENTAEESWGHLYRAELAKALACQNAD